MVSGSWSIRGVEGGDGGIAINRVRLEEANAGEWWERDRVGTDESGTEAEKGEAGGCAIDRVHSPVSDREARDGERDHQGGVGPFLRYERVADDFGVVGWSDTWRFAGFRSTPG